MNLVDTVKEEEERGRVDFRTLGAWGVAGTGVASGEGVASLDPLPFYQCFKTAITKTMKVTGKDDKSNILLVPVLLSIAIIRLRAIKILQKNTTITTSIINTSY